MRVDNPKGENWPGARQGIKVDAARGRLVAWRTRHTSTTRGGITGSGHQLLYRLGDRGPAEQERSSSRHDEAGRRETLRNEDPPGVNITNRTIVTQLRKRSSQGAEATPHPKSSGMFGRARREKRAGAHREARPSTHLHNCEREAVRALKRPHTPNHQILREEQPGFAPHTPNHQILREEQPGFAQSCYKS